MALFRAKSTDASTANTGQPAPRSRRRIVLATLFAFGLIVGGVVWYVGGQHNFHEVVAGRFYRSAQLDKESLLRVIHERGIKSIFNLRGPGAEDWYVAETNATQQLGLHHFDYTLSAGEELTDAQMDELMALIDRAPKPVLIHCKNGSDRTGLAGALYLYALEGQSAETAGRELTIFRGHFPYLFWRDTIAMDRSFRRYVDKHPHQTAPPSVKTDTSSLNQDNPPVAVDR